MKGPGGRGEVEVAVSGVLGINNIFFFKKRRIYLTLYCFVT